MSKADHEGPERSSCLVWQQRTPAAKLASRAKRKGKGCKKMGFGCVYATAKKQTQRVFEAAAAARSPRKMGLFAGTRFVQKGKEPPFFTRIPGPQHPAGSKLKKPRPEGRTLKLNEPCMADAHASFEAASRATRKENSCQDLGLEYLCV